MEHPVESSTDEHNHISVQECHRSSGGHALLVVVTHDTFPHGRRQERTPCRLYEGSHL